ncbi:hypothetical protein CYY_005178 [Polysphondylium violaceum]|uniref:Uncharacterized protein n=1 Tax=Polysphondylium violaceum TaxID=133409 RepID=A0A8J4V4G1_9MYCE|nr:hypothetical protein CYY_005178 [Polysphondylium violaceum]
MSIKIGNLSEEELMTLMEEMFMKNETSERYRLLHAGKGESGYSFGLVQCDCRHRQDGRDFIKALLVDENVDGSQVNEIISTMKDSSGKLSQESIKLVDRVLEKNKEKVDKFDQEIMKNEMHHIYKIVTTIGGTVAEKLLDPICFLQLLDYHNQFNCETKGKMVQFLKGQLEIDGKKLDLTCNLIDEIRRFINATRYAKNGGLKNLQNRQKNINGIKLPNLIKTH